MAATQERADLVLGLFDQYYERVYAFLRKSTTPDVAEDLAQEVFLRLLQHPELERLTISISYLLKIAHNLLRRRYARATRLRELLEERSAGQSEFGEDKAPAATGTLGDAVLETALGLLSKDEQDAIRLIVCEGKSYQHAAEALGVSVTTINNWKHRGIIKLRKLISDPNDPSLVDPVARESRAGNGRFGRETEIETFASEIRTPRTRPTHGARGSIAWRASDDAA
ncbi:MAG: RNA polymerase sigma factor [Planctomycetota bacterium]